MGTWFKWPNDLVDDPRFVGLSDAAWTLHAHAASYCSRNLTDGFIPDSMLSRLCNTRFPAKAARELVDAGMWVVVDGGWRIDGFEDEQQTRENVEKTRAQARERQKRKRARHADVTEVSRRDMGVSHDEVRVPDTDTDTDVTTTSRLTGLTEPVDNCDDDEDQQLAEHWITQHIEHRGDAITHPGALKRTQRKRILETIKDLRAGGGDRYVIEDELQRKWPIRDDLWTQQPPAWQRRLDAKIAERITA